MGINEVKTAPQSPWHNPYIERLIGSIRRDCMNFMIILNEAHLKCVLPGYLAYYHQEYLMVDWKLSVKGQQSHKIEPLR